MSLADAGRTQEQDIATFGQEAAGGEFLQQAPADGRLEAEVEVGQALEVGQAREAQIGFDDAGLARGGSGLKESAQEVGVTPALAAACWAIESSWASARGRLSCRGLPVLFVRRRCA